MKYILTMVAVSLAIVGVAAGASTKTVTRACFYVEKGGDPATYNDIGVAKKHKKDTFTCLVGKRGKRGKTGKAGAQGAAGVAGAQGPQGVAGAAGKDGLNGKDGKDGIDGQAGAQGATGPAGAVGATGPAGPQGATGAQGPTGPAGKDGAGANIGDVYACTSGGNNAKIVDDPSECDPGHDTIYRLDGIKLP